MRRLIHDIFKNGSTTYFYSSLFFPKDVKEDVFTLYAFVRTADDFVDCTPQNAEGFYSFRDAFHKSRRERTNNIIIDDFRDLMNRKQFEEAWVESFLDAMEADLSKKEYVNIDETLHYMYGSAEVIGLMMAQIMSLPPESHEAAKLLGRSMQYINFIRDIQEDNGLGRTYLPKQELTACGLSSLHEEECKAEHGGFEAFIKKQIALYETWRNEALEGFAFIPKRLRIPIQTASSMYDFTAQQISRDPLVVFRKKAKPSKIRILTTALKHALTS